MGPSGSSALSRSEGAHCSHVRSCRKRFRERTITHSCVIPRQRQDCSQIPQPCRGSYKFCRLLENSTGLSRECRELFSTTSKWQNPGFHTHLYCKCGTVTFSACSLPLSPWTQATEGQRGVLDTVLRINSHAEPQTWRLLWLAYSPVTSGLK